MRIVVLGAGFGGLELTTRLSEQFGDDADVVLIDRSDGFVFGFSKLDVMFGKTVAAAVHHPYRDVVKPGVRFVQTTVRSIDPVAKHVETDDGPFDADILGVPVHRAPDVVVQSGMTVDGWIPVDPLTLETSFPGVYAVGDVTSVGTPKAGVFAEGQAGVVADQIASILRGDAPQATYDGRGLCYLEFGGSQVARVDVTFVSGQSPVGDMDGPSEMLAADKVEFGTNRVRRWFGRTWSSPV